MSELKKVRVKFQSFDAKLITLACQRLISELGETGIKIIGPIPLPTTRKIYCVLRSPHVNKNAREHFKIQTHSKILDFYIPTNNLNIRIEMDLDLPSGVTVQVKYLS